MSSGTDGAAMDAVVDHQVTYDATPESHAALAATVKAVMRVERTLVTTYFDTADHQLYRQGAMLRVRFQLGSGKSQTEAKIPGANGLDRFSGTAANHAANELVNHAQLAPVGTQTKVRRLLITGGPPLGRLTPDFVVSLDDATVETPAGSRQRLETELQIFTKLPWRRKVGARRVERFASFCAQTEAAHNLTRSAVSGYQAVPEGLLV